MVKGILLKLFVVGVGVVVALSLVWVGVNEIAGDVVRESRFAEGEVIENFAIDEEILGKSGAKEKVAKRNALTSETKCKIYCKSLI